MLGICSTSRLSYESPKSLRLRSQWHPASSPCTGVEPWLDVNAGAGHAVATLKFISYMEPDRRLIAFLLRGRWLLVRYNVVSARVPSLDLCFRARLI